MNDSSPLERPESALTPMRDDGGTPGTIWQEPSKSGSA